MVRFWGLVGLVLLAGCKTEEIQTVQYYLDNEDARQERLEKCDRQHGSFDDANCVNARQAQETALYISTGELWQDQLDALEATPSE